MGIVGKLVLNTLIEFTRMYATAVMASSMIKVADREWEQIKKGFDRMQTFNAEDVNLIHLDPELVSYEPKGVHTEALQVSPENIGKLALEFETEVLYDHNSGLPFLSIRAGRQTEDNLDASKQLFFRLSDWIVPLWGEIHVFRDVVFRNTFTFDNPNVAEVQAKNSQLSKDVTWGQKIPWDAAPGMAAVPGVYPTRDADDVNLMDAARSSDKPELRALAEKLSKPLPGPLPRSVRHRSTGAYGVIESFGEGGKVWVRMADQEDILEYDRSELEDIS